MTEQVTDTGHVSQEPANADNSVSNNANVTSEITKPSEPTQQNKEVSSEKTSPVAESVLGKELKQVEEASKIWGDDWKQKLAGSDDKLLKNLEKYKTPNDLAKGYLELQKKFSETRPIPQLAKDATPEQVKEYREKLGIPDSPEKYEVKLDGVVIGDHDKPVVDAWLKKAHESNMTPAQVNQSIQNYLEVQNEIVSERNIKAEQHNKETLENLQKQWGSDYKSNLNLINSYLQKELGEDFVTKLSTAVTPDGNFLINDLKFVNHFLSQAKNTIGSNTILPSSNDTTSLLSRKKELDNIAQTDTRTWFNSPELRAEAAEIDAILAKKKG